MEGFEHYVESIFGMKGPLSSERVKEKLRFLRSSPEDLKSKVDALPNVIDTNFENPKVSTKNSHNCFLQFLCSVVFKWTDCAYKSLNTHQIFEKLSKKDIVK